MLSDIFVIIILMSEVFEDIEIEILLFIIWNSINVQHS